MTVRLALPILVALLASLGCRRPPPDCEYDSVERCLWERGEAKPATTEGGGPSGEGGLPGQLDGDAGQLDRIEGPRLDEVGRGGHGRSLRRSSPRTAAAARG